MSQETGNAEDRPLSGAEARRLESEIAKNEAERAKLALETQWYSRRVYIQAVVAGIVLALLGLAWFFGYFQTVVLPLLQRELNVQELKLQELELLNNVDRLEIVKQNQELAAEQEKAIISISLAKEEIKQELVNLSKEYGQLAAKQQVTEAERDDYIARENELLSDSKTLKIEISELTSAKKVTDDRSERLQTLSKFLNSLAPDTKRSTDRRSFRLFNIEFDPTTPAELKLNDSIAIEFSYMTIAPGDVKILVHPFTEGKLSPGNAASQPKIYTTGSGSGKATITNFNTKGTIDQLRFQMISNDTLQVLTEIFVPVQFEFQ
ncbi:MAG: hypothetical protein ACE1Y2_00375 [Stenotrophomonas maltophilia]